jgi:hypothetical protein
MIIHDEFVLCKKSQKLITLNSTLLHNSVLGVWVWVCFCVLAFFYQMHRRHHRFLLCRELRSFRYLVDSRHPGSSAPTPRVSSLAPFSFDLFGAGFGSQKLKEKTPRGSLSTSPSLRLFTGTTSSPPCHTLCFLRFQVNFCCVFFYLLRSLSIFVEMLLLLPALQGFCRRRVLWLCCMLACVA